MSACEWIWLSCICYSRHFSHSGQELLNQVNSHRTVSWETQTHTFTLLLSVRLSLCFLSVPICLFQVLSEYFSVCLSLYSWLSHAHASCLSFSDSLALHTNLHLFLSVYHILSFKAFKWILISVSIAAPSYSCDEIFMYLHFSDHSYSHDKMSKTIHVTINMNSNSPGDSPKHCLYSVFSTSP